MSDGQRTVVDDMVDRILSEAAWLPREEADRDLAVIRTAILLEDALDITLTDAEIDAAHLSDREGIGSVVRSRKDP